LHGLRGVRLPAGDEHAGARQGAVVHTAG
jgi:hypothetical protein